MQRSLWTHKLCVEERRDGPETRWAPTPQASNRCSLRNARLVMSHQKKISSFLLPLSVPAAPPQEGWSSLHFACEKGYTRIAEALLVAGAKVGLEREDGCNALHIAAFSGHADCVNVLLKHNAEVDKKFRVRTRGGPCGRGSDVHRESVPGRILRRGWRDASPPWCRARPLPLFSGLARCYTEKVTAVRSRTCR